MSSLRALALAAVLTLSTGTVALAGEGGGYAQPARPANESIQDGEGGGYALPAEPSDIRYGEFWA